MDLRKLTVILWLALAPACRSPKPPVPPPGGPTCADLCANLAKHGCEAAVVTPEGATCIQVCQNIQESGVIRWNLECMSKAESCAAIDACEPITN
jgi:hypothetical protein